MDPPKSRWRRHLIQPSMQLWRPALLLWLFAAGKFTTIMAEVDPNIKSIPVCRQNPTHITNPLISAFSFVLIVYQLLVDAQISMIPFYVEDQYKLTQNQQPYLDTDMQSRWFDFGGDTIIRADQYVYKACHRLLPCSDSPI